MSSIPPGALVSRRGHVLANDLSDTETVMLDIEHGRYFGVRDVAKDIWDRLESPTSLDRICEQLLTRFDVDAATCRSEVGAFLDALHAQGLIDVHERDAFR